MSRRHHQAELFGQQRHDPQLFQLGRVLKHGEVNLAVEQTGLDADSGVVLQVERDAGPAAAHLHQQRRHDQRANLGRYGERHGAAGIGGCRLGIERRIQQVQDGVEPLEQAGADWGRGDPAPVADQQLGAQRIFQLAKLLADRGRGNVQILCGASQIAATGGGGEVTQLAQFQHVGARRGAQKRLGQSHLGGPQGSLNRRSNGGQSIHGTANPLHGLAAMGPSFWCGATAGKTCRGSSGEARQSYRECRGKAE